MTYGYVSEAQVEELVGAIRGEAKRNGFGNAYTFGGTGNYAVVGGVLWVQIESVRNPFFRGETVEDIHGTMWYSSEGDVRPEVGLEK